MYVAKGRTDRLVKFDPSASTFSLNDDHELVTAYSDDPRSQALLEDVAAAEVLLEVYMREAGIDPYLIGEVLERRDMLLRSLSQDRVYSLDTIVGLVIARPPTYRYMRSCPWFNITLFPICS